ncbi:hypothetical protein FTX61_20935 [Nitriliruptoraceae bacterium ZYF776]|nr:hypothetical protein [Profundirhabdus halotolerans]
MSRADPPTVAGGRDGRRAATGYPGRTSLRPGRSDRSPAHSNLGRRMTEARPHTLRRGALVALAALLTTVIPSTGASAQSSGWNASVACPADLVRSSGLDDATGVHGPAIDCLAWYGLTQGRGDGSYGTNDPVRRDATASFIVRTMGEIDGLSVPGPRRGAFTDVRDGVHRDNIERLANVTPPIVAGRPDGTYQPREQMTRAQFASITARMLDELAAQGLVARLPASGNRFNDTRGSVHEANIDRLAAAGIVAGRDGNRFDPNGIVTRGQTASILARILGGLVDRDLLLVPETVITGIVNDGEGLAPGEFDADDGVSGAQVHVFRDGQPVTSVTADADGRYRVQLPQPGDYRVFATASGFAGGPRVDLSLPGDDAAPVNLRLYRSAARPATSTPTTVGGAAVTEVPGFWRVGFSATGVPAGATATEFRWELPLQAGQTEPTILRLGQTGTGTDSYWERGEDGTGAYANGAHVLYTLVDGTWYRTTLTFQGGVLTQVNGSAVS